MFKIPRFLNCLKNPLFTRLYLAQTINLVGDAFTWLGLALLAFELVGEKSGLILSIALTLRVIVFVVLAPLAGVIADQLDRKRIMVVTHFARMAIVCAFPFVTEAWQIYSIVLGLNIFGAFFTPTYTATIPLVATEKQYPKAIALSSATYQLLGVLGPGLAGSAAAFVGIQSVFFLDGITFMIAGLLILILPGQLMVNPSQKKKKTVSRTLQDISTGTTCLWQDTLIRHSLLMQFVVAISGAAILVNTVGYVQGILGLGKLEYGWVMTAFGIGATLTSISLGTFPQKIKKTALTTVGAILITLALLPANFVGLAGLLIFWLIAGVGQTLVNVPTQTLIADRVAIEVQGRVYGAHFAWSHLWWFFSYPLVGWIENHWANTNFLGSSLIGAMVFGLVYFKFQPRQQSDWNQGQWHEHQHNHDEYHQHDHSSNRVASKDAHTHIHFHNAASNFT
ncbi:MFS transporter [Roseofilum reptotaenium CS-1145]|uniref:MFS transporter n=1 Tax=Roseofilum reptotaenium AO1-A TaxID=1925591 RepID=A0A1L9QRT0_9CYAN|nr:MFS transporter [Roseofilum reptotaenium]MDB9515624.1 MFS transporter [Roseofilum reptotaenium CS-1145]OJJ25363.1 MFS transporter [Roseofilum reptotaenium AO1-A]